MKIFRKIFRMPRINWASYLLMVGVAMIVVAAAVMVKAIFFSGSNAAAPAPATRTYVLKLEGGGNILVPVPSDKVGQFTAAVNEAIANSSLALRPFLMDSLAARIVSVDSSGAVAQAQPTQPQPPAPKLNQVPFWQKTWFVWIAFLLFAVVLVVGVAWWRRSKPGSYILILLSALTLIICWALFFRLEWRFMIWPATLVPLVIFIYIRKIISNNWWKAINHPIAHVYIVAWVVMFFIIVVAGVQNHGGSF